jgi:hypothetical protein
MTFGVIIMVMIFVAVAVFGFLAGKKRRTELTALAGRLGLRRKGFSMSRRR